MKSHEGQRLVTAVRACLVRPALPIRAGEAPDGIAIRSSFFKDLL